MRTWSMLFIQSESEIEQFYSSKKDKLFRIRFSELFEILNMLDFSIKNLQNEEIYWNVEYLKEQINLTLSRSKILLDSPDLESKDSELFYEIMLQRPLKWTVRDLKIAYYTKTGCSVQKIQTLKRIDENNLLRIKGKLKKHLRLRQNESLSFYLSNFY